MSTVKALGYIGCEVTDLDAWEELLGSVFGLARRTDTPKGLQQYRIDDYHHRLSLYNGETDRLVYIGWELETQEELDALAADLEARGVEIRHGTVDDCADRAVKDLYIVSGPDRVQNEIYFGPVQELVPFSPTRGISGYNTGELGMGHVVLATADTGSTIRWYQEMLGLRLSDHIHWDGIEATFMHCNPRHHSLAIHNEIGAMKAGDLNHFMLEASNPDDIGRAYDIVNDNNVPIAFTYGKHTNDRTTSFYIYTPSGWLMELGYGGALIDDDKWEPKFYNSPKIWGHNFQAPPES